MKISSQLYQIVGIWYNKIHINQEMKDNSQRAKIAMILIGIVLLFDILTFGSSYLQFELLERVHGGLDYTDDELETNDLREGIVGLGAFVVYIISVVTFIMWFRRAYFNLHTIGKNLLHKEGWAAGAWFVPILNLFRPYQIMDELYSETNIIVGKNFSEFENKSSALVGIWWVLWLINNFISNHEGRKVWAAESIEEYLYCSKVSMVSAAVEIPLALLAIKVIYDYSQMEKWLYRLREGGANRLDLSNNEDILDAFDTEN